MKATALKAAMRTPGWSKTATARTLVDAALARFASPSRRRSRSGRGAKTVPGDRARFPSHPPADEAIRRIGGGAPTAAAAATPDAPKPPPAQDLSPADRLRRAESLSKDRHWTEVLAELGEAAGRVVAGAGGRTRLPDRHDEVRMRRDTHWPASCCCSAPSSSCRRTRRRQRSSTARGRCRERFTATTSYRGLPQGHRAVPESALGRRGAIPVGLARLQSRPLQGEPAGVPGHAGSLRQQRIRRRRRAAPGVRALPARQRQGGDSRLSSATDVCPRAARRRPTRSARGVAHRRARLAAKLGKKDWTPRPAIATWRAARPTTACCRARGWQRPGVPSRSTCRPRR